MRKLNVLEKKIVKIISKHTPIDYETMKTIYLKCNSSYDMTLECISYAHSRNFDPVRVAEEGWPCRK